MIALIGGLFYKTIKRVNAVEMKRKNISDHCTYLIRYLMKLRQFFLVDSDLIQMCKDFHIGIKKENTVVGISYNGIEIIED